MYLRGGVVDGAVFIRCCFGACRERHFHREGRLRGSCVGIASSLELVFWSTLVLCAQFEISRASYQGQQGCFPRATWTNE